MAMAMAMVMKVVVWLLLSEFGFCCDAIADIFEGALNGDDIAISIVGYRDVRLYPPPTAISTFVAKFRTPNRFSSFDRLVKRDQSCL